MGVNDRNTQQAFPLLRQVLMGMQYTAAIAILRQGKWTLLINIPLPWSSSDPNWIWLVSLTRMVGDVLPESFFMIVALIN